MNELASGSGRARCPNGGARARPNILMFGDWHWRSRRSDDQQRRLEDWLEAVNRPLCVEIGAGTAIPSIRRFSENCGAYLVRINPNEAAVPDPAMGVGLPLGGLTGIRALAGL